MLRSRPVRIVMAALLVITIISPAAVVAAVVWTAPPVTTGVATAAQDNSSARLLPPADVQSTELPAPAFNVYANTMSGTVPCPLCQVPERVYVPNSSANTVDVIDPNTYKVIAHYAVGQIPHHIAPAWDMSALYVDNEGSSYLTVLDIHTGRPTGQKIYIPYPYNLYFTPDGTKAIDVVERLQRIEFRDWRHGWKLLKSVGIPWPGADHLDFSADGSYLMISTEYSGVVAKVDVNKMALVGSVNVGGLPIDVKVSPDGSVFYVTNQGRMGVSVIDPVAMKEIKFIPTGRGAHGLQVSRDTRSLYVSNRLEGSMSVISFATRSVTAKWWIPGGGSPDMLQLNPAGTRLWASGRYNATVYVFDTTTGQVVARIPVGSQDHGLTYFPNAGLHSLGHNGVYR
ncbi:MAG TPA: beta-propeller fold lactonase family protein [Candidatus Dormibacteraeota bacterium]|nr:beta-propeller fold lactonase family protein [Candidatus Dormibacteraeota bacterium]